MKKPVEVVRYEEDILQVKLQNVTKHPVYIAKIFQEISNYKINIDMISQIILEDCAMIDFTCKKEDQSNLNQAIEKIKQSNSKLQILESTKYAKLHIEGSTMALETGIASKVFTVLGENDIHFYQVTTSDETISCLILKEDIQKAVTKIKEAFTL